ncbi:MAG: hypothetical protein ACYC2H_10915 [Thermoplasmatota archaeon]
MRWLLAPLTLTLAFAGCIDASPASVFSHGREDCSIDQKAVANAESEVLMPDGTPEEVRQAMGSVARITVHAREGQIVQAVAAWSAVGGEVEALFDGPRSTEAATDRTYSSYGEVSEGNYTLELVGDPMAFGVTYTFYLVAVGCTPIP